MNTNYFRHAGPSTGSASLVALGAFGLGALLMYFLDPVSGRRRRALARDQAVHARRVASECVSGTVVDLRNRAYGVLADTKAALRPRSTSIPESSTSPMTK